ncbi:hypothetical protein E1A91_A02G181900v1 [Gossypium mustelinum]|uniref:Uncharacterized protein n=1 Tax=Gossypium mustelinum TaxID=34275 RepID=A0A5D3ABW2_GOSMU|nr:hypothetical protein E1A91_A02G181900v1 [Gossypium mustelinum]
MCKLLERRWRRDRWSNGAGFWQRGKWPKVKWWLRVSFRVSLFSFF